MTTRILLAVLAASLATAEPSGPEDVIDHLERTIAWYRHLQSVEQDSSDVLLRQSLHQASLKSLQLAFDFARAEAALLSAATQPATNAANPGSGNLQQAATRAADRIAGIQTQIAGLDAALAKASARQRPALETQREEAAAELDLAKEIQTTIQTIVGFSGNLGSSGGAEAGFTDQIEALERSVPEARHDKRAPPAPNVPATAPSPPAVQPASRGIAGLTADLFSLRSLRRELDDARKETDALLADVDHLRSPLLNEIRVSIRRADEIGGVAPAAPGGGDVVGAKRELVGLSTRFKQVSSALVPLAEHAIAAGAARSDLQESLSDLDRTWNQSARYLLLRALTLVGAILLILALSEVWRRATFRYVTDSRRRRQMLILRRIMVTCAVLCVLAGGFVTEFGSFATYAGFVTAGIAVALQNPILSVVGYFFLIGRYGIRVGDRVTISGVTGEVIEIGLVRIYMMELAADLHSTGRVVVFSNSVIFQPAALYKQMPGLDYVWRTVTLTLAGDSDFQLAQAKLNDAVEAVYQQYRESIDLQHRNMQRSIDVNLAAPHPETRLRFIDAGLEFVVRYPVELKQAALIDDRLMKALYDAIASDPNLRFAPAGRPRIQLAA